LVIFNTSWEKSCGLEQDYQQQVNLQTLSPLFSFGESCSNTRLKGMYLTYLMFDSLKQLTDSLHSQKSVQGTGQNQKHQIYEILS